MLPEAKDLRDCIDAGIAPPSITAEAWLNWEVTSRLLKAAWRGQDYKKSSSLKKCGMNGF